MIENTKFLISFQMLKLHQKARSIRAKNVTFDDLCFRLPIANIFLAKKRRRKRQIGVRPPSTKIIPRVTAEVSTTIEIVESTTSRANSSTTPRLRDGRTTTLTSSSSSVPSNGKVQNFRNSDGFLIPIIVANDRATTTTTTVASSTTTTTTTTTAKRDDEDDPFGGYGGVDYNLYDYGSSSNAGQAVTPVIDQEQQEQEEEDDPWGDYGDIDYYSDYYGMDDGDSDQHFEGFFTKDEDGDEDDDDDEEDPADDLPKGIYCDLVNTLNEKCLENSILEIWKFSESRIRKLTQQDIVNAVNRYNESPMYGYKVDYVDMLGNVRRNSTGHVVSARAAFHVFHTKLDDNATLEQNGGAGVELDLADEATLAWEGQLIETMFNASAEAEKDGVQIFVNVARR